jgi:hypothetical protein
MLRKKPTARRQAAARPRPKRESTLSERILALGKKVPPKERAKMPRDGAANHDHYIYGTPKQY